ARSPPTRSTGWCGQATRPRPTSSAGEPRLPPEASRVPSRQNERLERGATLKPHQIIEQRLPNPFRLSLPKTADGDLHLRLLERWFRTGELGVDLPIGPAPVIAGGADARAPALGRLDSRQIDALGQIAHARIADDVVAEHVGIEWIVIGREGDAERHAI